METLVLAALAVLEAALAGAWAAAWASAWERLVVLVTHCSPCSQRMRSSRWRCSAVAAVRHRYRSAAAGMQLDGGVGNLVNGGAGAGVTGPGFTPAAPPGVELMGPQDGSGGQAVGDGNGSTNDGDGTSIGHTNTMQSN
mmetsp:Transcript_21336/g.47634  ORF Transcript_21336/g.47634 Transcript_21336/m.47634 type:complete len:139 (-) Transcript_21336:95-511(-)